MKSMLTDLQACTVQMYDFTLKIYKVTLSNKINIYTRESNSSGQIVVPTFIISAKSVHVGDHFLRFRPNHYDVIVYNFTKI